MRFQTLAALLMLSTYSFLFIQKGRCDDLMTVTGIVRSGNTVQIDFVSGPGLTGLVVKGSADLAQWPDDLTAGSNITELTPGVYRAMVDVTGRPAGKYFVRIGGTLPPKNTAPSLVSPGDREIAPGVPFSTTLFATDPDAGDVLTFSLVEGPEGMSLDAAGGKLDWTPALAESGIKTVRVKVADRAGASDDGEFAITLTIWPGEPVARHAPVLTLPSNTLLAPGTEWTASAAATDADAGDILTYALMAGPEGLTLDPATGAMTWTPGTIHAGQHQVTVLVKDQTNLSDTGTFSVTVKLENRPPVAVDDIYITPKGETTTVSAPGVMTNDSDPDGNPMTAALVDDVKRGTLNFRPDGSFDYRPGIPEIEARYAYGFHRLGNANFKVNGGTAPVAADLNGDGKPEIIAVGSVNFGIGNTGWLVALTFDAATKTLVPLWSYKGGVGSPISIYDSPDPAVGDVNGDGKPEVVMNGQCRGEILIFSNTGELLVNTQADKGVGPGTQGGADCYVGGSHPPSVLADLDGDGAAEIITQYRGTNLRVYNGRGEVVWERPATGVGTNNISAGPLVADFDLDGKLNIYYAGIMFDAEGNTLWTLPGARSNYGDRFLAVANLDDDPYGEIVISTGRNPNTLRVIEHDGTCKWGAVNSSNPLEGCGAPKPFPHPGGPNQRALLIADLNSDGLPEIIAASAETTYNHLTIFTREGNILWQKQVTLGANIMGSFDVAAFDFNGDGNMELVVTGRYGTTFLSGVDGSTLFEIPFDDTQPGAPVSGDSLDAIVVDVENDGHAELLIASRDSSLSSANTGIYVYKDMNDRWMPARPVWNQSRYSITNVNADSTIPRKPAVNWLTPGLNNYGVNMPTLDEAGGQDSFTYRVSDGTLTSNLATVTLEIRRRNNPPVILSTPLTTTVPDYAWNYQIYATDPDPGDAVSVTLQKGPAGMTLDADRVLRWTPTEAQRGEHAVLIAAQDQEDELTVQSFTLRVIDAQPVPDVVGHPRADALTALGAAGFTGGRITQEDHPTVAAGSVISQAPPGGASEPPGAAVALVISTGPGPRHTDGDGDGYTPFEGDCNDSNPAIHPGAEDPAGDGIDQDCDGIDGNLVLASIIVEPVDPRVLANRSVPLTAIGVFTDGTSQNLTKVVTWSGGGPLFSSAAVGPFPVTATRGAVTGTTTVTVIGRMADNAPPLAQITAPAVNSTITGPVEVRGSAADANFLKYELAYAVAGAEDFTLIATGSSPVSDGVLGTFDPTMLINDQYTIRLTVLDRGGNQSVAETTVLVDENMKVGNFSLTFTDLQIPLSGIPITISRTYDSRNKGRGDFGVGWRLDVQSLKIRNNRVPGSGWNVVKSGLSFALQSSDPHTVSVILPDGSVEVFDLVITPRVSPLVAFPPSTLRARFEPRPGTFGQLESLENNTLSIFGAQPGPVELLDDITLAPYNPQRFRYTSKDGTVMVVHVQKGVQSVIDSSDNTLEFRPEGIFHSAGKSVLFTRDSMGRITAVTDPMGHVQRYTYDGNGDLSAHTDAEGHVTRFKYNRSHGLIEITDPLGNRAIRSEYDAAGRLTAVVDPEGHRTTFVHNIEGREEIQTDARGKTQRMIYDQKGNVLTRERTVTIDGVPVVALERFEYDARGNETLTVDADGVRTQTAYDARDNVLQTVVDPGGLNLVSRMTYDAKDNPLTRTDPLGHVTTYVYDSCCRPRAVTDPLGNTTLYFYDSAGRMIARQDPSGTVYASRFDTAGRMISQDVTDGAGALLSRTDFGYDQNGNEITKSVYRLVNGSLVPSTWVFAYNANNQRISETDPQGNVSRKEYNAAGKVVAAVNRNGQRVSFDYNPRGLRTVTTREDGTKVTLAYDESGNVIESLDAMGRKTTQSYDEFGRAAGTTLPDGSVVREILSAGGRVMASIDARGQRTDYTYDAAGRLIRTTRPEVTDGRTGQPVRPVIVDAYDAAGRRTATTDANGNTTGFQYDAAGRLVRTVFADGATIAQTFDAVSRPVSVTDEMGRTTAYTYDGAGRLLSVTQPSPDGVQSAPVTSYTYDMTGSLLSRTDALGRISRFQYDSAGRRTKTVLPSGQFTLAVYDPAGNIISQQDYNGLTTATAYDSRNRVLRTSFSDGSVATYAYNAAGSLTAATDASGTVSYAYDAMNRITSRTSQDGTTLNYTYDAAGNQTGVTTPTRNVGYEFDALARLTRVTAPSGGTAYLYDPNGNQVGIQHSNGTETEQVFDSRNRTLSLAHSGPGGETLQSFAYTFYANSRRKTSTESDGSVELYTYDGLNRLTEEQRTGTRPRHILHTYDKVGNRTAVSRDGVSESYTYDTNDRMLSAGGAAFTYDGNGNRTSRTDANSSTVYEWDARDRLVAVRKGASATRYQYDVKGNRIGVTGPAGARQYLIDEQSITGYAQVIEERGGGNGPVAHLTYGTRLLARNDNAALHFHMDAHGSTRLVTAGNGTVSGAYNYEGFGSTAAAEGNAPPEHLFTGEQFDAEVGLYCLRARYYDPATGSFLSRDPEEGHLDQPITQQPYLYSSMDPVNLRDPSGRQSVAELSIVQGITNVLNFGKRLEQGCAAKESAESIAALASLGILAGSVFIAAVELSGLNPAIKEEVKLVDFNATRGTITKFSLAFKPPGAVKFSGKFNKWGEGSGSRENTVSLAFDLLTGDVSGEGGMDVLLKEWKGACGTISLLKATLQFRVGMKTDLVGFNKGKSSVIFGAAIGVDGAGKTIKTTFPLVALEVGSEKSKLSFSGWDALHF